MKKIIVFAMMLAFVAVSCSKEQKTVNKLEGSWKATSAKVSFLGLELEVPVESENIVYTFHECKVKNGSCSGTSNWDGVIDDFNYTIGGEGTTIETLDSNGQVQVLNIVELEKETFKVDMDLGLDTTASNALVTFSRQN